MGIKISLNETSIDTTNFYHTTKLDEETNKERHKVTVDFKVSSSMYHDITVLLYENEFVVKVPEKDLAFQAIIHNYSTSITDLYKDNQVGDFHLELIERKDEKGY